MAGVGPRGSRRSRVKFVVDGANASADATALIIRVHDPVPEPGGVARGRRRIPALGRGGWRRVSLWHRVSGLLGRCRLYELQNVTSQCR